jgi:hypothetical protein
VLVARAVQVGIRYPSPSRPFGLLPNDLKAAITAPQPPRGNLAFLKRKAPYGAFLSSSILTNSTILRPISL